MRARSSSMRDGRCAAGTLGSMINPRIDSLLEHVDSNYASVLVAAKRARQINSYYHNLGEGTFDEFPPPMVDSASQELPDDRPRGSRRGQDQVPLPLGRGSTWRRAPPRRQRRNRRLQGARGRAPGHQGRACRARHPDADGPALRRRRVVRGAHRRAGPHRRVRARPRPRRVPRSAEPPEHDPLSHLELVRNADVFLIAPASANTIAKLAHGLADNLLTSAALAATCPVLVAPAMNNHMWEHAATQANLALLRERGVIVVEPGDRRAGDPSTSGGAGAWPSRPSCWPPSRPSSPARRARPWDGLKVLVTAGGTREPIDAVRYVGNRSSGPHGLRAGRGGRGARRRGHGDRRQRRAARAPARALRRRRHRRRAAGGLRARSSPPPTSC